MKYHCNHCFTKDVEGGIVYNKYFQTNRKDAYINHLQSPKHKKCVEKVKAMDQEQKTICECCGKIMTNDSYKYHYERNRILIDWFNGDKNKTNAKYGLHQYYKPVLDKHFGEIVCDEYKFGAKCFEKIEEYLDFIVERKKYKLDSN